MRLNNHLNEGRSKSITLSQARHLIEEKCYDAEDASDKGIKIYRGINSNANAIVIDPKNAHKPREVWTDSISIGIKQ